MMRDHASRVGIFRRRLSLGPTPGIVMANRGG